MDQLTPAKRQWLYGIAFSALTLAVAYKVISPEHAPMWLDLVSDLLGVGGTGTAALALKQQRRDGVL